VSTNPDYQQLRVISVKNAGDNAIMQVQDVLDSGDVTGAPSLGGSSGIDVSDSFLPIWAIMLKRDPSGVTKYYSVSSVAASDTLTLTLDGTAVAAGTGSGPDTTPEILTALAVLVNANATLTSAGFSASVELKPGTTSDYELVVTKAGSASFTSTLAASGATVTSEITEATSVTAVLHSRANYDSTQDPFEVWGEVSLSAAYTKNIIDRLDTRSIDRAFIEVTATDGRCYLLIGPSGA